MPHSLTASDDCSSVRSLWSLSLACAVALAASITTARAAIPNLEWQAVTTIDSPVSAVSNAAGASSVLWNDSWYIVYVKSNDLFVVARTEGVWQLPIQVSDDPAVPHRPLIQGTDDQLIVVWEDDRTGHPEIWTRSYDGTTWADEICLTEDSVSSRNPSFSTYSRSTDRGILVWEEGTSPSRIDGRWWDPAGFGPVTTLASGPADMREPTAAVDRSGDSGGHMAWVDSRHGSEEIYARWFYDDRSPGPEMRITDLAGPSTRPVIATGLCCGDYHVPYATIAFESTAPGGVAEIWTVDYFDDDQIDQPELRSLDDGVPSGRPNLNITWYTDSPQGTWCGELAGAPPRLLLTWTDGVGSAREHHLIHFDHQHRFGSQSMSLLGTEGSIVGTELFAEPRTEMAVAWVEDRDGQPTLVGQVGDILSCNRRGFAEYSWFTVGPAGVPATRMRFEDVCTGAVAGEGLNYRLVIDSSLDAFINWDPEQAHPVTEEVVDSDGILEFSLRGGGCYEAGYAVLRCGGIAHIAWNGVKSPDINGDCVVKEDDLAYVESQLGSDDFCADIDGSGLVDELDIAIVEDTMGDNCSDVADVPDPVSNEIPDGKDALALRVHPNPGRGEVQLSIFSAGEDTELRIVSATGRHIIDLGSREATRGWEVVIWDGKNANGEDVASGVYFAEARSWTHVARATVLVFR